MVSVVGVERQLEKEIKIVYNKTRMKESQIRKKAIEILEEHCRPYWFCSKVKYKKESDIFSVFDGVYLGDKVIFVQLTTTPNLSARRKKIKKWMKKVENPLIGSFSFCFGIEIWAWDKNKKEFKVEKLT